MRNENINKIVLSGFKNSKSGSLPEEWERVSLEKDCILISGLRPKGGASDEGIPSLGGEHITSDGRVNFSEENAKYIPEKFFRSMAKGRAEKYDILINKDGANTGKVAILKKKFYKDVAINEHLFILRSKKLFVQQYLFYWLFSRFGQKQITDRITGSAQPGLSSTFIKNFLVPRPTLPEQRKIAEILETVDNAIEKTDAIIEKYKRLKQGLMQDLLIKGIDENWQIRDEKTHKFKDSPLGRIPEEWEVVELSNKQATIVITDGSHYSPQPIEDSRYYILNIENIKNGRIELNTCKRISEKDYKNLVINKCKPENCDVLFTKDGTIGISLVFDLNENIVLLSSIAILRTSKNLNPYYLKYYLESNMIKKQIEILTGGSALKRIVLKDIKNFKILISPLPEQQRIASVLSQIDETIEKEQAYKEKLERIKKGLMEDLLTGRVRVNDLL